MFSAQANENSTELSESVPRSFIRGAGGGGRGGAGTVNTSSMKTPLMVITKLGNCLKCNLLQKISSFCVLEFLDSEHMY